MDFNKHGKDHSEIPENIEQIVRAVHYPNNFVHVIHKMLSSNYHINQNYVIVINQCI